MLDRKAHWENIYQTKNLQDVSWYQPVPETSLAFFTENHVPKDAAIIDVGGGDSFLVDHLLDMGYTDITVLDISAHALERAKQRLGDRAAAVNWIESDVTAFTPSRKYDVWHDRAAFHFLRETDEINYYVSLLKEHVFPGGFVFIGTFSEQGPTKCSGIEIHQYNEQDLSGLIADKYHKIKCIYTDHLTPFNTIQSFIFCSFNTKKQHNYMKKIFQLKNAIALAALFILFSTTAKSQTTENLPIHKIVMQATSADAMVQKSVTKQLKNLKDGWGDSVEIEIVFHGPGIDFLVSEKTQYAEEIKTLMNRKIRFVVCENSMRERQVTKDQFLPGVQYVKMGIGEIVIKQEQGWSYIKAGF